MKIWSGGSHFVIQSTIGKANMIIAFSPEVYVLLPESSRAMAGANRRFSRNLRFALRTLCRKLVISNP